jgi:hypothetical protein
VTFGRGELMLNGKAHVATCSRTFLTFERKFFKTKTKKLVSIFLSLLGGGFFSQKREMRSRHPVKGHHTSLFFFFFL